MSDRTFNRIIAGAFIVLILGTLATAITSAVRAHARDDVPPTVYISASV